MSQFYYNFVLFEIFLVINLITILIVILYQMSEKKMYKIFIFKIAIHKINLKIIIIVTLFKISNL